MAKKTVRYASDHQAELGKILRTVAYRHSLWKVFCDFVAMGAMALSNAVDPLHYEQREAEYMKIVGQYTPEEANELKRGFAQVVLGLEAGMSDFLGSLYMSLELGDAWKGQYFTPYEVSRMMAAMTMGDKAQTEIERKGYISVMDPCIGGGAMVIAAAHALHDAGINYQTGMHAVGVDIDIVAVHMAYIQLSLLHVPAVLYHGNSLSLEIRSTWSTPAHVLGFWSHKLRRAGDSAALVVPGPTRDELAELGIGEPGAVSPILTKEMDYQTLLPDVDQAQPAVVGAVNLRKQIDLF